MPKYYILSPIIALLMTNCLRHKEPSPASEPPPASTPLPDSKPQVPDPKPQVDQKAYDNTELLERVLSNRTVLGDSSIFSSSDPNGEGISAWFLPAETIENLIDKLSAEYTEKASREKLDTRDSEIIHALRKFINNYYVHIPTLKFKEQYSFLYPRMAIYEINGWNTIKLSLDNPKNIRKFIKFMLSGAHLLISEGEDLFTVIRNLKSSAINSAHSHYTSANALAGVYPNITWQTRKPAPIICALLFDVAISKQDDYLGVFFQLEGWPVNKTSSQAEDIFYHGKDYFEHVQTFWNISTYGMSPYSEKRGTTIFITKSPTPPNKATASASFPADYTKYAVEKRW